MQDKLADAMSPFEKKDSMHHSMGRSSFLENTSITIRSPKKTNIVSINSVLRYCLTSSLDKPCTQEEVGLKTCSSRTGTNSRRTSLPKSTSKIQVGRTLIRISCRWVLQTRRARSTSCLATRTRSYQDHRCGERTTHSVCGCSQLHA